jgi:hypothetical protein
MKKMYMLSFVVFSLLFAQGAFAQGLTKIADNGLIMPRTL